MYPIAEIFHSIQGEGRWTGTPMMFVRLAGCNVGQYKYDEIHQRGAAVANTVQMNMADELLVINKVHSVCTTFDGQRFLCDTDYHRKFDAGPVEIMKQLQGEEHICITGGEPFLHDLDPLLRLASSMQITNHIETSGTLPISYSAVSGRHIWLTCCPKKVAIIGAFAGDILNIADEWKVLVGPSFEESLLECLDNAIPEGCTERYLQPIGGVTKHDQDNIKHCLKLLQEYPNWKLSAQLHKFLELR